MTSVKVSIQQWSNPFLTRHALNELCNIGNSRAPRSMTIIPIMTLLLFCEVTNLLPKKRQHNGHHCDNKLLCYYINKS